MPKFVTPLQDEITRLARKEILKAHKPVRTAVAGLKKENSALKKRLNALEKLLSKLNKTVEVEDKKAMPAPEEVGNIKITPKAVLKMRKKHGLSRLKMADLIGTNQNSIVRWEQGKSIPQKESKKKLLAFSQKGKREVNKMLEKLSVRKTAPASKAPAAAAKPKTAKTSPKRKYTRKKTR